MCMLPVRLAHKDECWKPSPALTQLEGWGHLWKWLPQGHTQLASPASSLRPLSYTASGPLLYVPSSSRAEARLLVGSPEKRTLQPEGWILPSPTSEQFCPASPLRETELAFAVTSMARASVWQSFWQWGNVPQWTLISLWPRGCGWVKWGRAAEWARLPPSCPLRAWCSVSDLWYPAWALHLLSHHWGTQESCNMGDWVQIRVLRGIFCLWWLPSPDGSLGRDTHSPIFFLPSITWSFREFG